MRLSGRIALRYLRSKKSHGAVSAIAAVSIAGVAIATAAVVCVLSVFNGFHSVLSDKLDILAPDAIITPAKGKTIPEADAVAARLEKLPEADIVMPSIQEQALALYGTYELPVTVKGVVPDQYRRMTALDSIIIAGEGLDAIGNAEETYDDTEESEFETWEEYEARISRASHTSAGLLSIGAAARLGHVMPGDQVTVFTPRREGRLNIANPVASFIVDSLLVKGVYEARQNEYDQDMVVMPLHTARNLLQYTTEANAIEVKAADGVSPAALADALKQNLGHGFIVRDRLEQQQINFRMVNIEKWVSFLLLFFILVIASFNIITTMTMLVLEKEGQLSLLTALGMRSRKIGRIFSWESMYVSLAGTAAGIILGLILCLLQQHFGLIRLEGDPSSLIMQAYPVKVVWTDIFIILIPAAIIAFASSWITSAFARSRIDLAKG